MRADAYTVKLRRGAGRIGDKYRARYIGVKRFVIFSAAAEGVKGITHE